MKNLYDAFIKNLPFYQPVTDEQVSLLKNPNGTYPKLKSPVSRVDYCDTLLKNCADIITFWAKFDNEIKRFKLDPEGDCWNISSICAEYLALKGVTPYIYTIEGPMVLHVECIEKSGDMMRRWHVTPANELPKHKFAFVPGNWLSYLHWQWMWLYVFVQKGLLNISKDSVHGADAYEFREYGSVSGGIEARRAIESFEDNPCAVRLVPMEEVTKILKRQLGIKSAQP